MIKDVRKCLLCRSAARSFPIGKPAVAAALLQIKRSSKFVGCCLHILNICFYIEIQCCAGIRVSQNFLNAFHIRTIGKQERSAGVPQIVGREVRQIVPRHKSLDVPCDGVRGYRCKNPTGSGKYKGIFYIGSAVCGLYGCLLLLEHI